MGRVGCDVGCDCGSVGTERSRDGALEGVLEDI